jgi:spore maturation protein CgeB
VIAPHVMEGFSRAIEMSGYEHLTLDVATGFDELHLRKIEKFKPDYVLGYDFNGYIQTPEGYVLQQLGLPLIALHYDNPFYTIDDRLDAELRKHPEHYYNFIWDRSYLDVYQKEGYKNGFPIFLATDPAWFYPQIVETTNSYSFVGEIRLKTEIGKNQSPVVKDFITTAIDLKIKHPAVSLSKICRELMDHPLYAEIKNAHKNNPGIFWKLHYLMHESGSSHYRYSVLNRMNSGEIHIYGTDNWSKINIVCHDKVNYGVDLSKVYQRHAVNINLSSLQLETSVNNRVFDVFASNAFLLSDYKQDLEFLFPEYWKFISFFISDELEDKCQYYQTHESERRALTYELHKQVLEKHTYHQRLQQILRTIAR